MQNYIKRVIPTVYNYYKTFIEEKGYCPSYRTVKNEIGLHLDYTSKAVHWLVANEYFLELKKGVYSLNKEKPFNGFE